MLVVHFFTFSLYSLANNLALVFPMQCPNAYLQQHPTTTSSTNTITTMTNSFLATMTEILKPPTVLENATTITAAATTTTPNDHQ
jgi:hypothetical protein